MKNIDFLPEHYHHQRVLRHARLYWMGVGAVFTLVICVAASGQWFFRRILDGQLRIIEPQYAIAQQRQVEITKRLELKQRMEENASLYLYLEHPWPSTQLLAAVALPVPKSVRLAAVHLVEQANSTLSPRPGEGDTNHAVGEGEKAKAITPQSVLAELRGEHDRRQTILELSGETEDTLELHKYVDSLAKSPLFASASLMGLESSRDDAAKKVSKFNIRVVVLPGYGQPGAPAKKAGAAEVAVSGKTSSGPDSNPGGLP